MLPIQKLGVKEIYCSPAQDRQFDFRLYRVNNPDYPVRNSIKIYGVDKRLPTNNDSYNVFIIGNIDPMLLNLLKQNKNWYYDVWVNLKDDINSRNLIGRLYSQNGITYPREFTYYSFIDEDSLLIAQKKDLSIRELFNYNEFTYFTMYSGYYLTSVQQHNIQLRYGTQCLSQTVYNNIDKVHLQSLLNNYLEAGGDYFTFVNGYYTSRFSLEIPNRSYVEIIYDESIVSKETFKLSDLRVFTSTLDRRVKYFLLRPVSPSSIQYWDDTELYVKTPDSFSDKGVLYYTHTKSSMRNVTDKDYSLDSEYVNNLATFVSSINYTNISDAELTLYVRQSSIDRTLCYNSMKLHELYKLPFDKQLDVIDNTNFTSNIYRVETLENSDYFKLAGAPSLTSVTKELCMSALGYNGASYYLAYNLFKVDSTQIDVPLVYQSGSTAYEYDQNGLLTGYYPVIGNVYILNNTTTRYVEFIYPQPEDHSTPYYNHNETADLLHHEFRIFSADFINNTRVTDWEDITENSTKYTINKTTITFNETEGKKIKMFYLNSYTALDLNLSYETGNIYFPLTITENRTEGYGTYPCEIPYLNIDIYMNGYRLVEGLDYFLKFPYVSICNKKYLNYTTPNQSIHVRMFMPVQSTDSINRLNITGFVNNGVLTRNKAYDVRDDRLLCVFVDGKLQDRSSVKWSEEDNTARITDPSNGLPYTVSEVYVPLKDVTRLDTYNYFVANEDKNKKIKDLFNLVYPEPPIDQFNAIEDHYYIFSPVISTLITDVVTGNIPSITYTTPYDDSLIINLLNTRYNRLLQFDPVKYNLPKLLVEIHPHLGNAVITVDLYQYRFIANAIRVLTTNTNTTINLSGYLAVQS